MKRLKRTIAFSLISLITFIGITLFWIASPAGEPMNAITTEEIPVIRFTLGDTVEQMHAQSTYPFSQISDRRAESGFTYAKTANTVEYNHPGHELAFPPGLYYFSSVRAHKMINVTITPHLAYLSLEESLYLIEQLTAMIDTAGWERTTERGSTTRLTEDEIRAIYANPRTTEFRGMVIQRWKADEDALHIELRRHKRAGETHATLRGVNYDEFLVSVKIANKKVSFGASEEVRQIREQRKQEQPQS